MLWLVTGNPMTTLLAIGIETNSRTDVRAASGDVEYDAVAAGASRAAADRPAGPRRLIDDDIGEHRTGERAVLMAHDGQTAMERLRQ